jgi:peptide deformylase
LIRPILKAPHPALQTICSQVMEFDDSLKQLAQDLIDTLRASERKAVGLSAPQIGDTRRVFLMDFSSGKNPAAVQIFVNPTIRKFRGKLHTEVEGCLSLEPTDDCRVRRWTLINWVAQDLDGKPISGKFSDFAARVFQHEADHLQGILITDKAVK